MRTFFKSDFAVIELKTFLNLHYYCYYSYYSHYYYHYEYYYSVIIITITINIIITIISPDQLAEGRVFRCSGIYHKFYLI